VVGVVVVRRDGRNDLLRNETFNLSIALA